MKLFTESFFMLLPIQIIVLLPKKVEPFSTRNFTIGARSLPDLGIEAREWKIEDGYLEI